MTEKQLYEIPISEIHVVNPRTRNKRKFEEVLKSISAVGLKRPITVVKRCSPENGIKYDLVVGQGRMEAFLALGQTTIPANVIEASREDQLVMSLVENIARRPPCNKELFREVVALKSRGYDAREIAAKLGRESSYISAIDRLIEKDEADLVEAVEANRIPLSIALLIADAKEPEIQRALSEAYESGELRGKRLLAAKRVIAEHAAQRSGNGEAQQNSGLSGRQLVKEYERRTREQQELVRRASHAREKLLLLRRAMRTLLADDHLILLLRDENLQEIPLGLANEED